jgi:hypothetical protein
LKRSKALPWLAAGYVLFAAAVLAMVAADVEVLDLFREASEQSAFLADHPWKGSLSTLGVFLWSGAGSAFLLAGAVLRSWGERGDETWFFLVGGAVSLLLGLDDGLTIHESYAEIVTGTAAAEKAVLLLLALSVFGWVIRFRRHILERTNWIVLALAAVGLGAGQVLDSRRDLGLDFRGGGLVEESVEFAGLATFLVYAAIESWRALARRRY